MGYVGFGCYGYGCSEPAPRAVRRSDVGTIRLVCSRHKLDEPGLHFACVADNKVVVAWNGHASCMAGNLDATTNMTYPYPTMTYLEAECLLSPVSDEEVDSARDSLIESYREMSTYGTRTS